MTGLGVGDRGPRVPHQNPQLALHQPRRLASPSQLTPKIPAQRRDLVRLPHHHHPSRPHTGQARRPGPHADQRRQGHRSGAATCTARCRRAGPHPARRRRPGVSGDNDANRYDGYVLVLAEGTDTPLRGQPAAPGSGAVFTGQVAPTVVHFRRRRSGQQGHQAWTRPAWCRAGRRASAGRPGIDARWLTRSPPRAGARGATALLPASTHHRPPTTGPLPARPGSPDHPRAVASRGRSGPVTVVPRAGDLGVVLLPHVKGLDDFLI